MGREYPVLVDGVQCGRLEPGTWRPSLAAAAEQGLVSPWLHVHYLLRNDTFPTLVEAHFVYLCRNVICTISVTIAARLLFAFLF